MAAAGERGERQRPVAQDGVVERPQVEAGAVAGLQLGPQPLDLELADHVVRTGPPCLFELLVVDDKIREILRKAPQLELLRKAARVGGMPEAVVHHGRP
jgi:hypothetical protein